MFALPRVPCLFGISRGACLLWWREGSLAPIIAHKPSVCVQSGKACHLTASAPKGIIMSIKHVEIYCWGKQSPHPPNRPGPKQHLQLLCHQNKPLWQSGRLGDHGFSDKLKQLQRKVFWKSVSLFLTTCKVMLIWIWVHTKFFWWVTVQSSVSPRLKIKHLRSWPKAIMRAIGAHCWGESTRGPPPLVGGLGGSPPKNVLKFYMPFGGI